MPRLHTVDPSTETGPGADFLNGPLKSKQINIFKGIATNPGVLKAFVEFAGGVKTGALTPAEHEIVALTVAQNSGCDYCLSAHTAIAASLGIDEEAALGIRKGRADDARSQALIDFVHSMHETKGFVSDEQLDAFRAAGFDDAAVIETIAAIAVNGFTNLFNQVNETEIDFPVPAAV